MVSEEKRHIVIIGGGIIGCTTAYYLTRHPKYDPSLHRITLLEATDNVAAGASGKAGGLLGKWAYPASLAGLSYRLHAELAVEHGGTEKWGYRRLLCGEVQGVVTAAQAAEVRRVEGGGGPDGMKVNGDGTREKSKSPGGGQKRTPPDSAVDRPPTKKSKVAKRTTVPLPTLDWLDPACIDSYTEMGNGPETAETAQVHPRLFTTAIAEMAKAAGVEFRFNCKVTKIRHTKVRPSERRRKKKKKKGPAAASARLGSEPASAEATPGPSTSPATAVATPEASTTGDEEVDEDPVDLVRMFSDDEINNDVRSSPPASLIPVPATPPLASTAAIFPTPSTPTTAAAANGVVSPVKTEGAEPIRGGGGAPRIQGVEYEDRLTGQAYELVEGVTDVVVAAGPWTSQLLPRSKVEGLRVHSVVFEANLKPHALFSNFRIPLGWMPPHREGVWTTYKKPAFVDPEIYPRPNGEVYACGQQSLDDINGKVPLPATADLVEADYAQCDDLASQIKLISPILRRAPLRTRQACYVPNHFRKGRVLDPMIGPTDIRGLWLCAGHTCWGIQNGPGSAYLMSRYVMDGGLQDVGAMEGELVGIERLLPTRWFAV